MELSVAYLQYLNSSCKVIFQELLSCMWWKPAHTGTSSFCLCTTKISECLNIWSRHSFRNLFSHISKQKAKAWEEIKRFFSVSLGFYLIFYHLLLFIIFWAECSLCKQLALQLRSLISPIIDLLPVLPESKPGSVSEHPAEGWCWNLPGVYSGKSRATTSMCSYKMSSFISFW